MAIARTARPMFIPNTNRLYPAQYYSRPAVAPMIAGNIGYIQRNLVDQYKYTLQQMAVSPFSVNDSNYMSRIREQYGIGNEANYNLYGNIGGFLGAGLGGAFALGFINSPKKWLSRGVFSKYNPRILANRKARDVALAPKDDPTKYILNKAIVKHSKDVKKYNEGIDAIKEAALKAEKQRKQVDILRDTKNASDAALEQTETVLKSKAIKHSRKTSPKRIKATKAYEAAELTAQADNIKLTDALKNLDVLEDQVKVASKYADDVLDTLVDANKAFNAVEPGSKIASKSGGFAPILGIGIDAVSLGMSGMTFWDSIQAGDVKGMWINGIVAFLDAAALIANFVPGGIGDAISIGASLASAGVSGWYAGSTIGKSFSPEGLQAQANFFNNLQASVINRPISTASSLLAIAGVQAVASAGSKTGSSWSKFWTTTGMGNFARSTLSMSVLRLVNQGSSWLENELNMVPTDPSKVNFTNGIGIWGDVNDNLFGATTRKTQLASLLNKDITFGELYEKSWGLTDKQDDIHAAITFADVRESAGIDFKNVPIINSVIDIVGEVLVDPQNYVEAYQQAVSTRLREETGEFFDKASTREEEKIRIQEAVLHEKDPNAVLKIDHKVNPLGFLVGPQGVLRGNRSTRKRLWLQLVDAWSRKNKEGLREVIGDITTSHYRGSRNVKYEVVRGEAELNTAVIFDLFDKVFNKGDYSVLNSATPADIAAYTSKLQAFEKIVNKIETEMKLSVEEDDIKKTAVETMARLKAFYGEDSEKSLVQKFMDDFNVDYSARHLRALYQVDQDVRFHTDIVDDFSNITTWSVMPIQQVVKRIRHIVKVLNNYSRRTYPHKTQSARTILEPFDVLEDSKDDVTSADIARIIKRQEDARKKVADLEALLEKTSEDLKELVDQQTAYVSKETEAVQAEQAEIKAFIKEYKLELEKVQEELDGRTKYIMYPTKVYYNARKNSVEINSIEDARALLNEAIEFERTEIESKGMTINQYRKQFKDSVTYQEYEAKKLAASDYLAHVKYNSVFKATTEYTKYALSILSGLTVDIFQANANLWKSLGYFRTYYNTTKRVTRREVTQTLEEKLIKRSNKVEQEFFEQVEVADKTKQALDKVNEDLKASKEELLKENLADTAKELLSERVKKLETEASLALSKATEAESILKDLNKEYEKVKADLKEAQEHLVKMANFVAAKKAVKLAGRKWTTKDFDKDTMIDPYVAVKNEAAETFSKIDWDKQTELLDVLDTSLALNGVKVYYLDEKGNKQQVIVNKKLMKLPKGASLQVEFDVTLEQAFYGALADILTLRSKSVLLANTFEPLKTLDGKELTPEMWRLLGPAQQADLVTEMMGRLGLTTEELQLIDKESTTRNIAENLNAVALQGNKRVIQIEELDSPDDIRALVIASLKNKGAFKEKYDQALKVIAKVEERFEKVLEKIEASNTTEFEKVEQRMLVDYYVEVFNKSFKHLESYKYIKSDLMARTNRRTKLKLFFDEDALKGNVLPKFSSIKWLMENPEGHIHNLEDALVKYVESESFQIIAKQSTDSIEYIKTKSDLDKTLKKTEEVFDALLTLSGKEEKTEQDLKTIEKMSEELDNLSAESEKLNAEVIKLQAKRLEKDLNDVEQNVKDDAVKEKVDTEVDKIIKNKNIDKASGVEIKNRHVDRSTKAQRTENMQYMRETFGSKVIYRDHSETVILLTPTRYFKSLNDTESVGYLKVLEDFERRSPEHKRAVRRFAEHLYQVITKSKGDIKINNLPSFYPSGKIKMTDKELFIQRVILAYTDTSSNKAGLEIVYRNTSKASKFKSTTMFRGIVKATVRKYMLKHKDDEDTRVLLEKYFDEEGNLSDTGVSLFSKQLVKRTLEYEEFTEEDKAIIKLRDAIWKEASETFENAKVSTNNTLGALLKHIDQVHKFERTDIRSLGEGYYTVSYDTLTKLAYRNPKMLELLNNVIDYDVNATTQDSLLFSLVRIFEQGLSEDYEDKSTFILNDVTGIKITNNIPYLIKKDGSTQSLFNVIYIHHVDILHIRTLLNKFIADGSIVPEMRAEFEQAYMQMVNTHKDLLSYQPNNMTKAAYLSVEGNTEEEWDFIESNPDVISLYNMLALSADLENVGEGGRHPERYKLYLNKEVIELFSLSTSEALKTLGIDRNDINQRHLREVLFGMLVLKSNKLSEEQKKYIVNELYFYKSSLIKARYTDNVVKTSEAKIKRLTAELEKAGNKEKKIINGLIIKEKNLLARAKDIDENLEYEELADKDIRFKKLLKDPTLLASWFGFFYDTDSEDNDRYVMARDYKKDGSYTYVPVKKERKNSTGGFTLNVSIESKGVPPINLEVIRALKTPINEKEKAAILEAIEASLTWNSFTKEGDVEEIHIGEDGSIVLITKSINDYKKDGDGNVLETYESANGTLHKNISRNREALLKEINKEDSKKVFAIYTMARHELNNLLEKKKLEDIKLEDVETETIYVVERDKEGKIVGELPPFITTNAVKSVVPALFRDLTRWSSLITEEGTKVKSTKSDKVYTQEELVDALIKFAKLSNERTIPNQAFFSKGTLSSSETLRRFKQNAESMLAYYRFLDLLEQQGIPVDELNLDRFMSNLYSPFYIFSQPDGSMFDLEKLSDDIRDKEFLNELKNRKVKGESYYVKVQKALEQMQVLYEGERVHIDSMKIAPDEFLDTLDKLRKTAQHIILNMGNYGKNVQRQIVTTLNRYYDGDMPYGASVEELRNMNMLSEIYLTKAGIRPDIINAGDEGYESEENLNKIKDYQESGINEPVRNNREEFKKVVGIIKNSFDTIGRERLAIADIQKERHEEKKKAQRKVAENKKKMRLHFKQFSSDRDLWSEGKLLNEVSPVVPYESYSVFKETAEKLHIRVQKLLEKYEGKTYHSFPPGSPENREITGLLQFFGADVKTVLSTKMLEAEKLITKEDFERYVANLLSVNYINNIIKNMPMSEQDIIMSFMFRLDLSDEDATDQLREAFKKNKEKAKKMFKKADDVRIHPASRTSKRSIDNYYTYAIGLVLGETPEGLEDALSGIMDSIENKYYPTDAKTIYNEKATRKVELKAIIKEYTEQGKLEKTTADLLEDILETKGEAARDIAEYILEAMRNRYLPDTSKLSGEAKEKLVEGFSELDKEEVRSLLKSSRKSKKVYKDYSSKEIWDRISLPILQNDSGFYKFLINEYFSAGGIDVQIRDVLSILGIKDDATVKVIKKAKTLEEIRVRIMEKLNPGTSPNDVVKYPERLYAFIEVINAAKRKYLVREHGKKHDTSKYAFNWYDAYRDHGRLKVYSAMGQIKDTQNFGIFSGTSYTSATQKINDEVSFLFDALAYIDRTNKKLGHVMVPMHEKKFDKNTFESSPVRQAEPQVITQARRAQHQMYSVFFVPETSASPASKQAYEIRRDLNVMSLDMINEQHATSWDTVSSTSNTYYGIRSAFNKAMYILYSDKLSSTRFITNVEAAGILKHLEETGQVILWANLFNTLEEKVKQGTSKSYNEEKLNEALKEAVTFFKQNSSLKSMDEAAIKAVIGFALNSRLSKDDSYRISYAEIRKFTKLQAEQKHIDYLARLESLTYRLNSAPDEDEVARIIFGKTLSELEADKSESGKELVRLFDVARKLRALLRSGYELTSDLVFDTYIESLPEDDALRSLETAETTHYSLANFKHEENLEKERKLSTRYERIIKQAAENNHSYEAEVSTILQNEDALYKRLLNTQEILASQIKEESAKVEAERIQIYREILYNHPELLAQYALALETAHQKKIEAKQKAIEKQHKKYKAEAIPKLEAVVKRVQEINRAFGLKRMVAAVAIEKLTDAEAVEYITKEKFTWALEENETVPEFITRIKAERESYNSEKERLLNTPITNANGETIVSVRRLKNYEAHVSKNKLTQADLDTLKNYAVDTDDELLEDDKVVLKIVARFIKDVQAVYNDQSKTNFKQAMSLTKVTNFNAATKVKLEEILTKRLEGLKKQVSKYEELYSYNDKFAKYSRWYAGQAQIAFNELKKYTKLVEEVELSLNTVTENKPKTFIFLMDNALKQFLSHHPELSFENNTVDIIDFLTGSEALYENLNLLKEQKQGIKESVRAQKTKLDEAKLDDTLKERLDEQRQLTAQTGRSLSITAAQRKVAEEYRKQEHPYRNTNVGTYKNLRKEKYPVPQTVEEKIAQDKQVLEDIIEETIATSNYTRDMIEEEATRNKGKLSLHNSFVDSLIARLNYMSMAGKTPKDTFYTLDIETVEHKGEEIPYQITLIYNSDGKIRPVNLYFNNRAFHRIGKEDTDDILGFKARIYDMKKNQFEEQHTLNPKKPYKATDEDKAFLKKQADAEAEDIISSAIDMKNDSAFLLAFVDMFEDIKQNKIPIVAHDGKRFDLPVFDAFVSRYANKLLSNFYYSAIYNNNPDKILERYNDRNITTLADLDNLGDTVYTDEIINAFKVEQLRVINKLKDPATRHTVTDVELKQLDVFTDAIARAEISKHIMAAELETGMVMNQTVRERLFDSKTGVIVDVRNKVSAWLAGNAEEKAKIREEIFSYYNRGLALVPNKTISKDYSLELEKKIDTLLEEYAKIYEDHRNKGIALDYSAKMDKGRRAQVIAKVAASFNITPSDDLAWNVQDYIEAKASQIRQFTQIEEQLIRGEVDVLDKATALLEEERIKIEDNIKTVEGKLKDLQGKIDTHITEAQGYLSNMQTYIKNLQYQTTAQFRRALQIQADVNIKLADKSLNNSLSVTTEIGYKYQLNELIKDISKTVQRLEGVLTIMKDVYVDLANKYEGKELDEAFEKALEEKGAFKEDWFNFKDEDELKVYKQNLKDELKRYEDLIEDFKTPRYSEMKNKKAFDDLLKTQREGRRSMFIDLKGELKIVYDMLTEQWKDKKDIPSLNLNKIVGNDLEKTEEYLGTLSKELKEFFATEGMTTNDIRKNKTIQRYMRLVSKQSPILTTLHLLDINKADKQNAYELLREPLLKGLNLSKENILNLLTGIDNVKVGETVSNSVLSANILVKSLLTQIDKGSEYVEDVTNLNILNVVSGRNKTSEELVDSGEFDEYASSYSNSPEVIKALGKSNKMSSRVYHHALENDNKLALVYKKDIPYYRMVIKPDGGVMFIVGFHDQINEHTQTILIDPSLNPRFNLTYNYRFAYKPMDPVKPVKIKIDRATEKDYVGYGVYNYNQLNVKEHLQQFYKRHVPGISSVNVYQPEGVDSSYESIQYALKFYNKFLTKLNYDSIYRGKKDLTQEEKNELFRKSIESLLESAGAVNVNKLHLSKLDLVDITKRVENMFVEYVKNVRKLAGSRSFKDAVGVYQGLADRLLSRFNSLKPEKILNMLDPEFASTDLIDYDDVSLYEKGIDLINSPEGSMGAAFAKMSHYKLSMPFMHNTNSIRTAIVNSKLYEMYTEIGLTNALWVLEDMYPEIKKLEGYNNNIAKLWDKLQPKVYEGSDEKDYVVYLKDRTISTVSRSKEEDRLMTFDEEALESLKIIGLDKGHNIFTPDVVPVDDYEQYNKDTMHKVGINLTVTFANHARAIEDVILMDYDIGMAIGWDKGYKTFLGRAYGYKGGVRLEKDLYKNYGSVFVASADSVIKRSTYGAPLDMVMHRVGTILNNQEKLTVDEKKKFKRFIDSYNKKGVITKYITITDDNKFLVRPNTDHTDFFEETELFGDLKKTTLNERIDSLIGVDLSHVKPYKTMVNGELVTINPKGSKGWQGTLYVLLDSDHTTEHMTNKAEIRNIDGISVANVDESGTVLSGVLIGPSTLYSMLSKSNNNGMNWVQAFYGMDSPQEVINSNETVKLYSEIMYDGVQAILNKYAVRDDAGNIDAALTVKNLQGDKFNRNMTSDVREYFTYKEWETLGLKEGNPNIINYAVMRMAELNKNVRQEALEKYTGKNGVLNSALFKKHVGGRQQLLGNSELRLGQFVTNEAIWQNNMNHSEDWLKYEEYSEKEFKEDVLEFEYENGKNYNDDWKIIRDKDGSIIEYKLTVSHKEAKVVQVRLNSMGLVSKKTHKSVKYDLATKESNETETTFTIHTIKETKDAPAKLMRSFGWMLSLRSPVQNANAVPLMKVVGFHDHQALEANKYTYKMIGGDNDGDTIGMILIDKNQYKHLYALDASKREYYDADYFDEVDKDYTRYENGEYFEVPRKDIKNVGLTISPVGKRTFSSYEVSPGVYEPIRTEHTLDELYLLAFPQLHAKRSKLEEDLEKIYKVDINDILSDVAMMRTYVNVLIRNRTSGNDNFTEGRIPTNKLSSSDKPFLKNDGYKDVNALKKFITDNEKEIKFRVALSKGIKENKAEVFNLLKLSKDDVYALLYSLDKADREYLKDNYSLFKGKEHNEYSDINKFLSSNGEQEVRLRRELTTRKVLNKLLYSTVTRVRGSKYGIESLGGNKKIQFISSLILRLNMINRDGSGDFLKTIGAYTTDPTTGVEAMTPLSMARALFEGDDFEEIIKTMSDATYKEPKDSEAFFETLLKVRRKNFELVEVNKKKPKWHKKASNVSLADAFKAVLDDKLTDKEAEEHALDTLRTVSDMLYDAYVTSKRTREVFTELADALTNPKGINLHNFFKRLYNTKEEIATLYPNVQKLRELIIADPNYELASWEIRWLKVQFFGAQQKEADAYFRLAEGGHSSSVSKLNDKADEYAQAYLNEHIIGRQELNILDKKSSTIIGVAKHFGSDIRASEWLQSYIEGLVEEISKHNVRLTNMDPARQYLSLAIAMDKNPFETFDEDSTITDKAYDEALEALGTGKDRLVLKGFYGSAKEGKDDLDILTDDSMKIQLLKNIRVPDVILKTVTSPLQKLLEAFEKYDISTEEGLLKAAKESEEFAKVLIKYGISGRHIRNVVDDYVANFTQINQTLIQNNKAPMPLSSMPDIIKHSLSFMEIMYKVNTPKNRKRYEDLLRTQTPAVHAVIQDELKVDTYYYTTDDDGNLVRRTDNNDTGNVTSDKALDQEILSMLVTKGDFIYDKVKKSENGDEILGAMLKHIKLNLNDRYYSIEELKQSILKEYYALRSIYVSVDKQREESKKTGRKDFTPDQQRRYALKTQQYDNTLIEEDLNRLTLLGNNYAGAEQKIKKLEAQQRTLIKQRDKLAVQVDTVVRQKDAMSKLPNIEKQIEHIRQQKEHQEKLFKEAEEKIRLYAFNETFASLTPLLHSDDDDAYTIRNLYTFTTPKLLTEKDVERMKDNQLMNMHHRQSHFLASAAVFVITNPDGTKEFDSKAMYRWMQSRYDHLRLTVITYGDDDEGLLKRLYNTLFEKVETTDKKGRKSVKMKRAFKNKDELIKKLNAISKGEKEQDKVFFDRQEYEGIDTTKDDKGNFLVTKGHVTPTLKEINIRSHKDLELIYEIFQNPDYAEAARKLIGFVNMNDIMDAYDLAYIPFKHTGWGSGLLQKMYSFSKLMQRISTGFLLRNYIDTWNQLYSEAQQKYGVLPTLFKTKEIWRIMSDTSAIKDVYQTISLDRVLYLTALKAQYQDMTDLLNKYPTLNEKQTETVLEKLDNIMRVVTSYGHAKFKDIDKLTNSIQSKQGRVKDLINELNRIRSSAESNPDSLRVEANKAIIERSIALVGSMKFAEYFMLYDKLEDVLDDTRTYQTKNVHYIDRLRTKHDKHWDTLKQDLFEVSAFMQTNAQLDQYQTDQAGVIKAVLNDMLDPGAQPLGNYEDFRKAIDKELSSETTTFWKAFGRSASAIVSRNPAVKLRAAYDWMTADTENTGRLAGYMLDKYLHNLTFEQSVDKSLTRFFNYGSRSPLELNMIADFPYLSFPVRSINNWIDRITDPRYLRFLSDLLDGIYGQYADEDGQYDEYVRYQMANGWIPIAGGIGIRAGNGAFDVMQILTDTSGQIEQRKSPLGRMINAIGDYLVSEERDESKLLGEVIKQSAVVGFAARGVNQITAMNPNMRNTLSRTPVVKNIVDTRQVNNKFQGVVKAMSATYWYETDYQKYTPKKYDYSRGNGRYKYYENIYKDWFNKYGRMRKPKVDPYSLVKDIQWKNYVRWRRQQYMNKYK